MNNIFKIFIAMLFVTMIGTTIPVTMAYADDSSDTQIVLGGIKVPKQTYTYNESDFTNIVNFENTISEQINNMVVTNDTNESDFKDVINNVISKSGDYKVDIISYTEKKSTKENSGKINFSLDIIDSDKNHFAMNFEIVIPKSEIYVYETIPYLQLENRYIRVTNPEIIDKAINGLLDTKSYLVTNKALESDKLLYTGWQKIDNHIYHIYYSDGKYYVNGGWANIDGFMYHFSYQTGVYNRHLKW